MKKKKSNAHKNKVVCYRSVHYTHFKLNKLFVCSMVIGLSRVIDMKDKEVP